MAYRFYSKLDVVLKVLYSEDERNQLEKRAMQDALIYLDDLKAKSKSPIKYSADLWKLSSPNYQKGKTVVDAVIRLENSYILAQQYSEFIKETTFEIDLLLKQLFIIYKMQTNSNIAQEILDANLNLPLNDCNEILRYIKGWDMQHFILPKYKSCVQTPQRVLEEFKDPIMRFSLQELGLDKYVDNLVDVYKKEIARVEKQYCSIIAQMKDIERRILVINSNANYRHYCPLDAIDKSRVPIGNENDDYYQVSIKKLFKEYEKYCQMKKQENQNAR